MHLTIGLFLDWENELFFVALAQRENLSVIVLADRGAKKWFASGLNLIYRA
jgi:hypothetical protein